MSFIPPAINEEQKKAALAVLPEAKIELRKITALSSIGIGRESPSSPYVCIVVFLGKTGSYHLLPSNFKGIPIKVLE